MDKESLGFLFSHQCCAVSPGDGKNWFLHIAWSAVWRCGGRQREETAANGGGRDRTICKDIAHMPRFLTLRILRPHSVSRLVSSASLFEKREWIAPFCSPHVF